MEKFVPKPITPLKGNRISVSKEEFNAIIAYCNDITDKYNEAVAKLNSLEETVATLVTATNKNRKDITTLAVTLEDTL